MLELDKLFAEQVYLLSYTQTTLSMPIELTEFSESEYIYCILYVQFSIVCFSRL